MGREIRRVALDFDWPLGKVWKGFINPHGARCPVCPDSRGYTEGYLVLDTFIRHLLLAAEASDERPESYVPTKNGPRSLGFIMSGGRAPSNQPRQWPFDTDPAEVLGALAGEEPSEHVAWVIRRLACIVDHPGMFSPQMARYEFFTDEDGHRGRRTVLDPKGGMYYPHPYMVEDYGIADVGPEFHEFIRKLGCKPDFMKWSGDWDLQKAIFKHHGYKCEEYGPPTEFLCPFCKGEGIHPDAKEAYENWKSYGPPEGDGYQLWSTTTEGHPMSPVFDTPEKLASWLAENKVSTFGTGSTMSYERWLKFIRGPGWAPSMVGVEGVGISTGVEFFVGGDE